MAELVELAVLIAMSLVLVVRVVFRPTAAGREKTRAVSVAGEATALHVVGSAPSRTATQIYGKLVHDARGAGLVIDWERARRDQASMAPRTTLSAAARTQIGQRPKLASSPSPKD